ncbi:MAG TPA: glycosyltransferase [bacterium]|nr:glycosyltransferase [bacterium]
MNILHVLSGDLVTGSETSTAALIRRQTAQGHRVFIAAGSFQQKVDARFIPVPIYRRSLFSRLMNIVALRGIVRRERIDLIHAHSRAASWVAHWACRLTHTAYLSTLHGRQHLHFSSRRSRIYGPRAIAVCEDIRDQMMTQTRAFEEGKLEVIRNGIEIPRSRS